MSTKRIADVIFCIDASSSMQPCIDAVRNNLTQFVNGLQSGGQSTWDVRFDFLAHRASDDGSGSIAFSFSSLQLEDTMGIMRSLYGDNANSGSGAFFTKDVTAFTHALGRVQVAGDEAPLVALDTCLDYPWREATDCHRVVILLTDEPFETGIAQGLQLMEMPRLIKKIEQLQVMLFLVGPQSAAFDSLCAVDKSEYQAVDGAGAGLHSVDFGKVLQQIGKSVSVANTQQQTKKPLNAHRGIYGQPGWGAVAQEMRGS